MSQPIARPEVVEELVASMNTALADKASELHAIDNEIASALFTATRRLMSVALSISPNPDQTATAFRQVLLLMLGDCPDSVRH